MGTPRLRLSLVSNWLRKSLSFLPLTLGVSFSAGAGGGNAKLPLKAQAEKVLSRDDFTCRFCGFRSLQYQRVVPHGKNFVTACGFCEQALSLDRVGMAASGLLIWLPEIAQIELNHLVRAIYVARAEENAEFVDIAERAYNALLARRAEAKKRIGSEDPAVLATVLLENLTPQERQAAAEKLDGIRLLCFDKYIVRGHKGDFNAFPQIVSFWKSPKGPYADMPIGEWQKVLEKISA